MRRAILVAALLGACGRVGFDPLDDGGGAGGGGDGTNGGMACTLTGTPSCPQTVASLSLVDTFTAGGPSVGNASALTGSCGGAGAEERTVQFLVQQSGTYTFTTAGSNYDTVLYAQDTCAGTELACNDDESGTIKTSKLTLALTAGQNILFVIDGANGQCGTYSLRASATP